VSLAVQLHLFHCSQRIVHGVAFTRNVTIVFPHSRVERTPVGSWMWFFSVTGVVDPSLWSVGRTFLFAEVIDPSFQRAQQP
jgi:hypothetical protein